MQRGKKLIICVAQCVAALVPVHRPFLLSDVYCFLIHLVLLSDSLTKIMDAGQMIIVCTGSKDSFVLFQQLVNVGLFAQEATIMHYTTVEAKHQNNSFTKNATYFLLSTSGYHERLLAYMFKSASDREDIIIIKLMQY